MTINAYTVSAILFLPSVTIPISCSTLLIS